MVCNYQMRTETMKNLFLTSSGLNEKTAALFWECIGKEPVNTKAILVPSAAVGNDGAREGILVCIDRLTNMGIPLRIWGSLSTIFFYTILPICFRTDIKGPIQVILMTYLCRFA